MRSAIQQGLAPLRIRGERLAFWLTLLFSIPIAGAIGFFLHESIGIEQVALFIVAAMLYVTLARGRLLGSSVLIHEAQYPRVFAIVKRACASLDIPLPLVFVREDYQVPAAALGFGEPYALVLSSTWIEAFQDDELSFIIGRQLGHIAMGHARYNSLLSVNGRENPIVAAIFGAWLRRCELTCDRVGLLCCGSLDAAMRAIAVEAFHHFGRRIDLTLFAQQNAEILGDPVLRWGQWLSGEPYATTRIDMMRRFIQTTGYQSAEEWFLRADAVAAPSLQPAGNEVSQSDCSGWWRRLLSVAIDVMIVFFATRAIDTSASDVVHSAATRAAETTTPNTVHIEQIGDRKPPAIRVDSPAPLPTPRVPYYIRTATGRIDIGDLRDRDGDIVLSIPVLVALFFKEVAPFWFFIYCAVLVGTAGQTFGMMITGLRVVRIDYRRPGFIAAVWRYIIVLVLGWLSLLLSPIQRRIMLHDRLSGTRLIRTERILQRRSGSEMP